MPAGAFAIVIVAEALLWRPIELVIIVNNGMGKFGRAAMLAIISAAIRAVAAVIFVAMPARRARRLDAGSTSPPMPPR